MGIEEIHQLLHGIIARNASSKFGHPKYTASINSQELFQLCTAAAGMLPIVRAAESWHRVNTGMHTNGPQHMLAMRDTRNALVAAIDTWRKGRGE